MLIDIDLQSKEKDRIFAKKIASYILNSILEKDRFYSKANPVFFKADLPATDEDISDVESVGSTDDVSSQISDNSETNIGDVEPEDTNFNNDGYDVENEADIWDKE
jgi:hypothetical protein